MAIVPLAVYTGSFAIGLGPVFWLLISEIYPGNRFAARPSAWPPWPTGQPTSWWPLSFLTLLNAITNAGTFLLMGLVTLVAVAYFWKESARRPKA